MNARIVGFESGEAIIANADGHQVARGILEIPETPLLVDPGDEYHLTLRVTWTRFDSLTTS